MVSILPSNNLLLINVFLSFGFYKLNKTKEILKLFISFALFFRHLTTMSDNLSNLLSFEECSEIYAQTEKNVNENLSSFKIENFETEFFGFLGEYYRLICQGTKGTKAEYFLKSIPIKDEADKRRVQRIGVFQKETSLYKTLIKDFDKYGEIFIIFFLKL